jgi:hypothetical protein
MLTHSRYREVLLMTPREPNGRTSALSKRIY